MLRVLLADTDGENLKNFKTYIKMAFPDIRIVGGLNSSANFISQVKELSPDLIIADIRFFGAAATRMIRDTYEFFPDKRFIIYGTYNDADYMEKVMEYGVCDYLYRPVKPADLEKCLNHAKKVFEDISRMGSERERLVGRYKDNISLFRDKFMINLLNGSIQDINEIISSLEYFGIGLLPDYAVFTVRIDHFKKIILTLDEMEKHLLVYKILLIINEGLARVKNGAAVVNNLNELTVIMGDSPALFDTVDFCEELRLDILHQTQVNVTVGLGRVYNDPRDIAVSYKESEAALRYRHYMGYGTVIPIQFVEPMNNITYRYPLDKEERLVYSAVTGEYKECKILLEQIIAALRQCSPLPERLIPKIMLDILFSINRFASEQHMNVEERFSSIFPTHEIIKLDTLDKAQAMMDAALKGFCAYVLELRSGDNAKLVEKVKAYIEEHFNENISLTRLAAHAGTTPEFLSNIFLKAEGRSVYQYAISIRMQSAERLLKEGALSIDEVAAA
ncbi:MAG: response regulator, partial [Clostridiales bacterium]|nr:response regulator [Clostridiales bacterium]